MKTFSIRVGMVVYCNNWFWVVERKQNESWRLRALATNELQVLPISAFFDDRGRVMTIVSEHPGNPIVEAPIEILLKLAKELGLQANPRYIEPDPRTSWVHFSLSGYVWADQRERYAGPREAMP